MNKIKGLTNKAKGFYEDHMDEINLGIAIVGGIATICLARDNYKLLKKNRQIIKDLCKVDNVVCETMIKSQGLVKSLIEEGKKGSEEYIDAVIESGYCFGVKTTIDAVIKDIIE